MKKHFAFEYKIVAILVVVLLLVGATGFLAYRSLLGIVQDVNTATRPDARLSLLKQIMTDLSEAESSVKSYNLTGNSDYLAPFYNSIASVDDRMEDLKQLSRNEPVQLRMGDSLQALTEKKYRLLDELMALHYDERVISELKKISMKLEKRGRAGKPISPAPEKKQSNIFTKIFRSTQSVPPATPPVTPDATVTLREVEHELLKANQLQLLERTRVREKELALTQRGKEVMDRIRSLIAVAEQIELFFVKQRTQLAENRASETNLLITFFCVAIGLLLVIISYIIVGYVRRSKRFELALSKAKTEAENLARARENFLANMSHEIRTPMNAIAGFTEQVLKSELGKEQKSQLQVVKKSADHLLKIINDILDFSRIRAGKLSLEKIGFTPGEIVEDATMLLKPQAQTRGIDLVIRVEPDMPWILIGDPMRFRQILLNVIGNAIKFTEAGEVLVKLSCPLQNEDKVTLALEVRDTGIGIPPEKMAHIFDEFEQADSGIAQKYGGTGLGLTITKNLVEQQGGHIAISSEAGKGATVQISIPYPVGTPVDMPGTEPEIRINGLLKGKKILVADDEAYNRMLIGAITKKWGVRITESRTGKEAYEEVVNNHYDMVLMDVRMPDMDGISASTRIRQLLNTEKAKIPIIALTAVTATEDIERCRKAGINDFLAKPFTEKDLYRKMTRILPGQEHAGAYTNPNEKTTVAERF